VGREEPKFGNVVFALALDERPPDALVELVDGRSPVTGADVEGAIPLGVRQSGDALADIVRWDDIENVVGFGRDEGETVVGIGADEVVDGVEAERPSCA
jgi:hypothetical protein